MKKLEILKRLANAQISEKSKNLVGEIVRKEFDLTEDEERAFELLKIAFIWQLPQFGQMLDDYQITDFKWF